MSNGRFYAYINKVIEIASDLDLIEEYESSVKPIKDMVKIRRLDYKKRWEIFYRERYYSLRLYDQSLIRFEENVISSGVYNKSYSYIECPFDIVTYRKYVNDVVGADFESVRETYRADYDEYVSSSDIKQHVTPIRYDFDATSYKTGCHPASHIHIGFESDVRIATERLFNPISFLLMILRQCYPDCWAAFIKYCQNGNILKNVRGNLKKVCDIRYDHELWSESDENEVYLK